MSRVAWPSRLCGKRAADGERADLLRSLDAARAWAAEPENLILVGWSLGGTAAAGLTIHAGQYGIRVARTVCLAGAFMVTDPITGMPPAAGLPGHDRCPFTLLHGVFDTAVPVEVSQQFAAVLARNGWPVELTECRADHGSIAGATYDVGAKCYSAAREHISLTIAADVAARITDVPNGGYTPLLFAPDPTAE